MTKNKTPEKDSIDAELVQTAAVAVCWLQARGYSQLEALYMVIDERKAQDKKFGSQRSQSSGSWLAILAEEFGEIGTAILNEEGTF